VFETGVTVDAGCRGDRSVILERASLRPIQKVLRSPLGPVAAELVNRGGFKRGFAKLFASEHPLSAEEAEGQWELLSCNDGNRIPHLLISYLDLRLRSLQYGDPITDAVTLSLIEHPSWRVRSSRNGSISDGAKSRR